MGRKGSNSDFQKRSSVSRLHGGDAVKNDDRYFTTENTSYHSLDDAKNVVATADDVDEPTEEDLQTVGSSTVSASSETGECKSKFSVSLRNKSHPQAPMETESKLRAELLKYKKELKDYNDTTKDLEEKYVRINCELAEMQEKHDRFVANRKKRIKEPEYTDSSENSGSEYALQRKLTQVFHNGGSFLTLLPPEHNESNHNRKKKQQTEYVIKQTMHSTSTQKRLSKRLLDNKENEAPLESLLHNQAPYQGRNHNAGQGLTDIYNVLKTVLDTSPQHQNRTAPTTDIKDLLDKINSLQKEQDQFLTVIQQQKSCLHDYQARCIKAQQIMQTQQSEIEKLNSNNQQLESAFTGGIDKLRAKINAKLRDVAHLPQKMRQEQAKCEKYRNENGILTERLRTLQKEMSEMKAKLEDIGRRKSMAVARLKAAERDLKIFKNYNASLKQEKQQIAEELNKFKEHLEAIQTNNKRMLVRHREQSEKQRRELQKRIFDLELKLSRSQSSTSNLIHERDSLIAELQGQLNTLVHNFEVSQKHIRVLRRHIYTMSGNNAPHSAPAHAPGHAAHNSPGHAVP